MFSTISILHFLIRLNLPHLEKKNPSIGYVHIFNSPGRVFISPSNIRIKISLSFLNILKFADF